MLHRTGQAGFASGKATTFFICLITFHFQEFESVVNGKK